MYMGRPPSMAAFRDSLATLQSCTRPTLPRLRPTCNDTSQARRARRPKAPHGSGGGCGKWIDRLHIPGKQLNGGLGDFS